MAWRPRTRLSKWVWCPLLLIATLFVLAAIFPWGLLRGAVEGRLSAATGHPVTIGALERADLFSWTPTLIVRDLRVAGATKDIADVRTARVRFPVLPLLLGRFRPEALDIDGMRLALARDAAGRKNWSRGDDDASTPPPIRHLTITDSVADYRDAQHRRSFTARLAADRQGFHLFGPGEIHGNPVRLDARAAPIADVAPGTPWPFQASISGKAVGMTLAGRADAPLDVGHFTASATGHGDDLTLLDAILGIGLPPTQPVRFRAEIRRDVREWRVTGLRGTIGRSDVAGDLQIGRRRDRYRVEGRLNAMRLDFADLSNDAQHARAAARAAQDGPRMIPATQIDISRLRLIDGTLVLRARTLLWPGSAPFRSMASTLSLDHGLLDITPMVMGFDHGRMTGTMRIDQRSGPPKLVLHLAVEDARLADFFGGSGIDGAMRARIDLTGTGTTIRAAVGRSTGTLGLFGDDGTIPARTASLLGQDLGRGLTTSADRQTALRCIIGRFAVRDGIARADPVEIDSARALTRASGSIVLATERLDLNLTGAPKRQSLLRMAQGITVAGTIKAPHFIPPPGTRSIGNLVAMLGRSLGGDNPPLADDLDCTAGETLALR